MLHRKETKTGVQTVSSGTTKAYFVEIVTGRCPFLPRTDRGE